jgi:hypothetical protein
VNSWSVTQPWVTTTKLRTSGRTVGKPPKLIDDSKARCGVSAIRAEGGSSCSRAIDAGDSNAHRHETEEDDKKRQPAECHQAEGERGEEHGCRVAAMRQQQPFSCSD